MDKKDREAVLKLWGEPLPNEDEYFKGVRENILKTINLLSARIDFLESQLKIVWHKYPEEKPLLQTSPTQNRIRRRNEMARYSFTLSNFVNDLTRKDAQKRLDKGIGKYYPEWKPEVVRILNTDEEKEFAWEWYKKGNETRAIINKEWYKQFEKEWKEQGK